MLEEKISELRRSASSIHFGMEAIKHYDRLSGLIATLLVYTQ